MHDQSRTHPYRKLGVIGVLLILLGIGIFFGLSAFRGSPRTRVTIEDLVTAQTTYDNQPIEVRGILNTSFGMDECNYGNGVLVSDIPGASRRSNIWIRNSIGRELPKVNGRRVIIRGWLRHEVTPCKETKWFIEATEVDLIESFELPSSLPRLP